MSNTIDNSQDVIDSRDIIERIEELESLQADMVEQLDKGEISESDMLVFDNDEGKELDSLRELAEQCQDYASDWLYGETLIHRDYFKTYMDDMIADCYELPSDMPAWMSIVLDYYALEQDYSSVDFDGQEFLIRNS